MDELKDQSTAVEAEVMASLPAGSLAEDSLLDNDTAISEPDENELTEAQEIDSSILPLALDESEALLPVEAASTDLVRYDPLQRYLSEIRHLPSLSREEEHDLALRYIQHGDSFAAYRLVLANLRLVVIIAREYQRNVQNIMDLIQEGNIGLLEAVKKFDPFRGIRFSSYASYWVRAYMLRFIINNIRLVKIGTTQAQRKLFFNLVKERERLEREGFVPEAKLLAERLNVKIGEVLEMEQRLALPDLSADAPLNRDDDTVDMYGVLPDAGETSEDAVVRQEFALKLRSALDEFEKTADAKEKAIIEQRLFAEESITLQEIADQFGVTRERIRQIENRLKNKLKEYLSDKLNLGKEGQVLIDREE